ncbi:MAG TPA: LysR substrate-binding domain-containing protein [Burkholderiales bacterium]|nr:LysR substrate-binding domain-containing protein [Burkholderiales bacterium]
MRHATLRQLKVFEAVARHLSFSRAAEELHLTQPAVSIQVKQLESHAGLPLFEQLGKKIYLTPAGSEVLRHARAIIQQFREAEEALAALRGVRGGRLNVAVISAGDYFFPRLVAEFCRRHEAVTVRLTVHNREELLRQLAENATDLAVLLRPPEGAEVVAEAFAPQPQVIVAAPSHPLAARRRIPLRLLAQENFIVREPGSDTRISMDAAFAERGFHPRVAMEIRSFETIKQAVMAGMGLSFLSAHTIALEVRAGLLAVLDVAGFPVVRSWHVVHHRDKRLPPVAAAFKRFLLEEGARLIAKLTRFDAAAALDRQGRERQASPQRSK